MRAAALAGAAPPVPAGVQVRAATAKDAQRIAEIHVCGWKAAYRGVVPDPHLEGLSVDQRRLYWSSAIASGEATVRVTEGSEGVSGWIAFGRCRDPAAVASAGEIWAIYVSPDLLGRGIGQELLNRALDELRAGGFASVSLWVLAKNERACRFYSAMGFELDTSCTKTVEIGGASLEEVRYVRRLAS